MIGDALEAAGMERNGQWTVYNGMTGEPMETTDIAPTFYQSLKHQVRDKVHARAARGGRPQDAPAHRGAPLGRRAALRRDGARLPAGARDVGADTALHAERSVHGVGVRQVRATRGGRTAARQRRAMCPRCDSADHVQRLPMPFATKLFMQELAAMNVVARIELEQ